MRNPSPLRLAQHRGLLLSVLSAPNMGTQQLNTTKSSASRSDGRNPLETILADVAPVNVVAATRMGDRDGAEEVAKAPAEG